jgi:hypothetical protein
VALNTEQNTGKSPVIFNVFPVFIIQVVLWMGKAKNSKKAFQHFVLWCLR